MVVNSFVTVVNINSQHVISWIIVPKSQSGNLFIKCPNNLLNVKNKPISIHSCLQAFLA